MDSILQTGKKCYLTGYAGEYGLDKHHIYGGPYRDISEANGFWVWLRHDRHVAYSDHASPHNDSEFKECLKRLCQAKYEETHSREEFMALINQNFLD